MVPRTVDATEKASLSRTLRLMSGSTEYPRAARSKVSSETSSAKEKVVVDMSVGNVGAEEVEDCEEEEEEVEEEDCCWRCFCWCCCWNGLRTTHAPVASVAMASSFMRERAAGTG